MNFYSFFLFGFLVLQILKTKASPVKPCDNLNYQKLIERVVGSTRDSNNILQEKIHTLPRQMALNIIHAIKTTAECETENLITFLKGNRTLEEHDVHMIMCFLKATLTVKEDLQKINLNSTECLQPNATATPPEAKFTNQTTTNQTIRNDQNPTNRTTPSAQDHEKDKTKSIRDVSLYHNISIKDDPDKPEGTTEPIHEGTERSIPPDANRSTKKWSA